MVSVEKQQKPGPIHKCKEIPMILETIIGSTLGGAIRLGQEFLTNGDKKNERAHELAMLDKQIELDKLKGNQQIVAADAQIDAASIQALIEGVKAQAQLTGIRWVDAISSLMRPIITFWWAIVMYSVALAAQYAALIEQGTTYIQAIIALWGPDEKAIVGSIIGFWFVDRSLGKRFK